MIQVNTRQGDLSVAIVEDERELICIYEKILARMGLPVSFVADNGPAAIARFVERRDRPRIVLMDNRLPGLSGIDVTREMLKVEPRTRVIFLSADVGARGDALKAGAFAFISKPASIQDIICVIEKAMGPTSSAGAPPDRTTAGLSGGW